MKAARAIRRIVLEHPRASDAMLAVLLAAYVQQDVLTSNGYLSGPRAVYVSSGLLMTLPLAWRRRAPLAVTAVVMAGLVFARVGVGSAPVPDSPLVAMLIAIYTVAAHSDRTRALIGGGISLVAGGIWLGLDDFFFPVVVFGGVWMAGRLVRQRELYAAALEERADAVAREREANARAAAADERARIARELHDVLAHSLSMMVVQAGAERMAPGGNRDATNETLEAIEQTGRRALAEMRRMLGVLRAADDTLPRAPQPTLAELEGLVADVRDAGLPVELRIEGEAVEVPEGIALSAYRIVQEALTNVMKHAGPAHASVVVRCERGELEIEVADDGSGPRAASNGGHGLVGMRERAALYGGELVTSAPPDGGFVVHARLPFAPVLR